MMFRVVKMIRTSKVDGLKASLGKKKKKKGLTGDHKTAKN